MRTFTVILLLVILFCIGCYLPRTAPLASANCHAGVLTTRLCGVGRTSSFDEISGGGGSILYGLGDIFGINLNLMYEEARHRDDSGVVSRYREFCTTVDLVFELFGGESLNKENILEKSGFAMAFYFGAGTARQFWRGQFFEDEDAEFSGTAFAVHTGFQSEIPFAKNIWSEFYVDLYSVNSLGYSVPYWTVGTNLCYNFSQSAEGLSAFIGISCTSVSTTVMEENWIAAAGIIWTFGGSTTKLHQKPAQPTTSNPPASLPTK